MIPQRTNLIFAGSMVIAMICAVTTAHAQGPIYGTVEASDHSNPPMDELFWVGFLDNTDEEIRIETNIGAGYDGLHWFDDFQNYTTEAAGSPYDYIFVDAVNGEVFRLENLIPSNSFQEENVVLSPDTPPARPVGLTAQVVSPSQIDLQWTAVGGITYHVYRRVASNNSVFFRLDDPSGNLANPGVVGSSFEDTTSDGVSEYAYVIMAEDAGGSYSAHSAEITVQAWESGCLCPAQADLDGDGYPTVLDLGITIDVLFGGAPDVQDTQCPVTRSDFDCDTYSTLIDLGALIDFLFIGGAGPCDPCTP